MDGGYMHMQIQYSYSLMSMWTVWHDGLFKIRISGISENCIRPTFFQLNWLFVGVPHFQANQPYRPCRTYRCMSCDVPNRSASQRCLDEIWEKNVIWQGCALKIWTCGLGVRAGHCDNDKVFFRPNRCVHAQQPTCKLANPHHVPTGKRQASRAMPEPMQRTEPSALPAHLGAIPLPWLLLV